MNTFAGGSLGSDEPQHTTEVVDHREEPGTGSDVIARVGMTSALIGAAMLVLRAALTGATSPRMTELMWLAVVVCALAALMALVSVVTMTRHPMVAFGSLAIALVFAAVAETLPAGPPRLLPLLPLLGALACILVSSRRRTVHRRAPAWQLVLGWLAFALYIPVGLLYLISGLVVPLSGIAFSWPSGPCSLSCSSGSWPVDPPSRCSCLPGPSACGSGYSPWEVRYWAGRRESVTGADRNGNGRSQWPGSR